MHLVVQGRNDFEVSDVLRQYAEKWLKKLGRFLDDEEIEVQVTVSANRGRYTVEVTVRADGYILRGERLKIPHIVPWTWCWNSLERQIEKYKTKLVKKKRRERTN